MTTTRDRVGSGRDHDRRAALWLFAAALCFYLLCTSGHIWTPDGVIMLQVTEGLVERADASIPGLSNWPGFGGASVPQRADHAPEFYAKYGLGLSLAAVPTYVIGRLIAPFLDLKQLELFQIPDTEKTRNNVYARDGTIVVTPNEDFRWLWYDPDRRGSREGFLAFCAAWTNSWVVAAILAGVFLIGRELDYSPGVALAVAVLTGVATPLWAYAKDFFSEPLAALGLTYFFYFALRSQSVHERRRSWLLAGLFLGVTVLAKPALIVLALPAGVLLVGYTRGLSPSRRVNCVVTFAAGLGTAIAITLLYNHLRFGTVWETGYGSEAGQWTTPPVRGLMGLLLSPGRGLLLYFPLWLLLLPSAPLFSERRRLEFAFILLSLATTLTLYATWHQWEGGICWGPRFLIPAIPLLCLPIGSLLARRRARRDIRIVTALVVVVSTAIAFSGTWVNYFEHANRVKWQLLANPQSFAARGITSAYQLFVFDLRYAPIGAYWTFPRRDFYFVFDAVQRPGVVLALYVFFAVAFVMSISFLWRAMTGAAPPKQIDSPAAGAVARQ